MRANVIEKIGKQLAEAVQRGDDHTAKNLSTKLLIVVNRKDDRATSVIREYSNVA